jgi:Zinc carboxypeptidase
LGFGGFLLALGLSFGITGTAQAETRMTVIGTSQAGTPLTLYTLGDGPTRVLVVGGQHGGPEENTVELANGLLEYFDGNPSELPAGIELDILPVANPDGLSNGSRQFVDGVDPNRNWGGSDWRADAYDSNAVFRVGLGGAEPFSEPETQSLANWILAARPAFTVDYHSAGGFMLGSGDLATAYDRASGYNWPQPGVNGQRSPLPYQASGSMNVWLRQAGLDGILVELTTPRGTEVERNLAGLKAVLAALGG